jgi:hypothetical protein
MISIIYFTDSNQQQYGFLKEMVKVEIKVVQWKICFEDTKRDIIFSELQSDKKLGNDTLKLLKTIYIIL